MQYLAEYFDKLFEMNTWTILGLYGNALFFSSWIVQWRASEKAKKSIIPITFWYLRLIGAALMITSAFSTKDLPFIVALLPTFIFYTRNIIISKRTQTGAPTDPEPNSET